MRALQPDPKKRKEIIPLVMLLLAAALIIIFAKIIEELMHGDLADFDRSILLALRNPENPEKPLGPLWLQAAVRDVTALGSTAIVAIFTLGAIGFLALERMFKAALFVAISVAGGSIVSIAMKLALQRPRPGFAAELAHTQTSSFPSGHAFLSAVVFLTLGAMLSRVQRREGVQIYIMSLAIALTLLVGVSRVYLGLHWPTDVLAGWCAGAAWAILCWFVAEWLQGRAKV